jgi:hypothetical protein
MMGPEIRSKGDAPFGGGDEEGTTETKELSSGRIRDVVDFVRDLAQERRRVELVTI